MLKLHLESNIEKILPKGVTLTEVFEENRAGFNEAVMKFWFNYQDDTAYPFEFRIEIGRNWSDDTDKTPIIKILFSTTMAKNGQFICFDNDILVSDLRKKVVQDFYFRFEEVVLEVFNQTGKFGYKREGYQALFKGFCWFVAQKALTPSGRTEDVPDITFSKNADGTDEQTYKDQTLVAEGVEARRYVRYFLNHFNCNENVHAFLLYVLQTNKPIRIVKERSYWNYTPLVRPDMLYVDTDTLSKLGYHLHYNRDKEEVEAMKYAFDLFSEQAVVNLCLDGVTLKKLNELSDLMEENPLVALEQLAQRIEQATTKNEAYELYGENYRAFLDGLIDLYAKYEDLYQQFGEARDKRRAEKAKRLWLRYTN